MILREPLNKSGSDHREAEIIINEDLEVEAIIMKGFFGIKAGGPRVTDLM